MKKLFIQFYNIGSSRFPIVYILCILLACLFPVQAEECIPYTEGFFIPKNKPTQPGKEVYTLRDLSILSDDNYDTYLSSEFDEVSIILPFRYTFDCSRIEIVWGNPENSGIAVPVNTWPILIEGESTGNFSGHQIPTQKVNPYEAANYELSFDFPINKLTIKAVKNNSIDNFCICELRVFGTENRNTGSKKRTIPETK